jgi:hypothetical protein
MREQPHEHRCEEDSGNYPKYDFDSCFNWLRDRFRNADKLARPYLHRDRNLDTV